VLLDHEGRVWEGVCGKEGRVTNGARVGVRMAGLFGEVWSCSCLSYCQEVEGGGVTQSACAGANMALPTVWSLNYVVLLHRLQYNCSTLSISTYTLPQVPQMKFTVMPFPVKVPAYDGFATVVLVVLWYEFAKLQYWSSKEHRNERVAGCGTSVNDEGVTRETEVGLKVDDNFFERFYGCLHVFPGLCVWRNLPGPYNTDRVRL